VKLPALAITAAYAGGIVLGLCIGGMHALRSRTFLLTLFTLAVIFILAGLLLTTRNRLLLGATTSLLTWAVFGVMSEQIADQPRATDDVLSLLEQEKLQLKTSLRWHGHLRDEPARLPWGFGYEIELTGVEYQNALVPASGGLRLSFSMQPDQAMPPDLHAGDEVAVLAQAKLPQVFRDDGAFDRRAYLASQNIDVVATLRSPLLLEREAPAHPTIGTRLARMRRRLREKSDGLFASKPDVAGVLRAMLLGDRTFVDRSEAADFQKTGVFHVLVVAGLHVGALAAFLFSLSRKLRLTAIVTMVLTLTLLFAYVAVVEQRPPVLRAAMMTSIAVIGSFFFRRLDLVNSAAVAALLLLIAKPLAIRDSSFQLTFLAIGCIAGLGAPWLEQTVQPYVRALRGWRDVTRDAAHEPRAAQFRIDLRSLVSWISARLPARVARPAENTLARGIGVSLRIWELLVLTVALQVGMLPLMARDFHRVTLSGPLANLAAVPLTGVIVPIGFLTLGTGVLFPVLGKILAWPLTWLTLALLKVVQWTADFQGWSYRIPGPPVWLIALFFVAAILLAFALRSASAQRQWIRIGAACAVAAGALLIAIYPFGAQWAAGRLEMTVLDVGQGDSLFVVSPHGRTMLIDGGGVFSGFLGQEERNGIDPGEEAVSPYLWSRGFQKIDVVALTHAHQDHLGGLTAILENFRVGSLWVGREVSSAALEKLEDLAMQKKIPIAHESRGEKFSWDGVQGEFLWPDIAPEEVAASAKNDDSLVFRMKYGGRSVMLPGDAEKQAEAEILAENTEDKLRADVLKVGHHGSKNSTTNEFLAAVHPQVAIISAGEDNPYGHPSPELLERLEHAGVRILRTDRDGAVHVLTDGTRIEVQCFVPCAENERIKSSAQAQTPEHK
jgi:competence protein ComEC